MQYLLFICTEPGAAPAPDRDMAAETDAWVEEMDRRRIRLRGDQLRPPSDATTVRVRDGETLLSDGPFAQTREQIAGFDLVQCDSLDEAIEAAAKHPVASFGLIEIRPLMFEVTRLSPSSER